MKHLVTGTEMKLLDNNTSDHFHVPSVVLMEQAALGFVHELLSLKLSLKKGIVFCGSGNNGGDGIAIARLLNERGIHTEVCYVADTYQISARYSELYTVQKNIYDTYGFPVLSEIKTSANLEDMLFSYDFVIDAVFGTGLSRLLSTEYIQVINDMNRMFGIKIAVDIPSGICADNGKVLSAAVKCDYTITFSFEKIGHFLWPGNEYVGKLICTPIGITKKSWLHQNPSVVALEMSDLLHLPKRQAHSNKGTYGKLLIIAGTKNMAGAAILAAKSAYRTGAGLVKIYTREENRTIIQTAVPEAILVTYEEIKKESWENPEKNMSHQYSMTEQNLENFKTVEAVSNSNKSLSNLKQHLDWADAVVLGPGIGTSSLSQDLVFEVLTNVKVPLLLDADALNILSQTIINGDTKNNTLYVEGTQKEHLDVSFERLQNLFSSPRQIVITPHLAEMSRLTQTSISQIQEHLIETAVNFSNTYHVTCVLKDFHTIIAHEHTPVYLNLSGNNGMATAGSGDVLSGIIGTFLAQGMNIHESSAYGVFLHGLAGDMAVKKTSAHGMCAQDIIEGLKEIWNKVEHDEKQ